MITASFPSNDLAAVSPLKFVDEAALKLPGLDIVLVEQRRGEKDSEVRTI